MDAGVFKALVVRETADGIYVRTVERRALSALPPHDVLIRVDYSSLNYKDALSATGNTGVTRRYPHTPGIDAAGVVEESRSPLFSCGDEVLVTGYDLGMNTPGGFGRYIRVPAEWVVRLPSALTLREAMICGTAGFTAAQSVMRLQEQGVRPGDGDILVTGATGGVGSMAVALLARAGYRVIAATGKPDQEPFLLSLGARKVIGRDDISSGGTGPLLRCRWAGALDTVGGSMLADAVRATSYRGAVTTCGNVASPELHLTVYPFILRGVSLLGIDSANCPREFRLKVWERLSGEWKLAGLGSLAKEIGLDGLEENIHLMLRGGQRGRVIVNLKR